MILDEKELKDLNEVIDTAEKAVGNRTDALARVVDQMINEYVQLPDVPRVDKLLPKVEDSIIYLIREVRKEVRSDDNDPLTQQLKEMLKGAKVND